MVSLNRETELKIVIAAVLLLVVLGGYYAIFVLPEIQSVNRQLKVCNCSAVCAGKTGYFIGPETNGTVLRVVK